MIGSSGLLMGVAFAMYRLTDKDKMKKYKSVFFSAALAVFLTGVTEPLEFMFVFSAPLLYVVYAIMQGLAFGMADIIHLRLHSFGNIEFLARLPMSIQAGLLGDILNFIICCVVFFVLGYFVSYFIIKKFNLATTGRNGNYIEDDNNDTKENTETNKNKTNKSAENTMQAERIIALLGGDDNIIEVDACMTRLRVTVKDVSKVAGKAEWSNEGAMGLIKKNNGIQAVYGPKADVLKSDINDILGA